MERTSNGTLTYYGRCPYRVGDEVKSPVTDSFQVWTFAGRAYVDEVVCEDGGFQSLKIYTLKVTQYYDAPNPPGWPIYW